MNQSYKVISPLSVAYAIDRNGIPKKFTLNLNIYRNANHFKLNQAKQEYTRLMLPMINQLPSFRRIELKYVLFLGSNRKVDLMNICSITDKFFCDVLVKSGKIVDDNCYVLPKTSYMFGGVDKLNPRVEIYIKEC